MQAYNVKSASYRSYPTGSFIPIPDVTGIEWIFNKTVSTPEEGAAPVEGTTTLRGIFFTHDANVVEKLIAFGAPGAEPIASLRFEFKSANGKTYRKTFNKVIFGTAGTYNQTDLERPPDGVPPIQRIAFVCAILPDGSDLPSIVETVEVP